MLGLVGLFGWVSCTVKGRRENQEEASARFMLMKKIKQGARRPQLEAELRNKSTAKDRMLEQFSRKGITEE